MKKLFKFLTLLIVLIATSNYVFAFSTGKLDKVIQKSGLDETSTIAISIVNAENGKVVYSKNSNKLVHPASTLKIPTAYFAVNTLGYDYFFKTKFYTHNKDLYIKLGADPLLTTQQLKNALKELKVQGLNHFENLYIDDSIIDKKEFSQGWMWDDDVNPYTPKVSAYNLDKNIVEVNITQNEDGTLKSTLSSKYPMSVFTYIQKNTKSNYYDINRYNWENPELIEIYGNFSELKPVYVPISSMRRYFIYNTQKILEDERITVTRTSYSSKLIPKEAEEVYAISNSIEQTLANILQNSNNLMAETIYKLAGGYKYGATGTDILSLNAMSEFYQNYDINFENVILKDGCGISRNNLVTAQWMTDTLQKIYKSKDFEKFKQYMAQPGDGTLSERLYDLRGDAWLKTGSLSNISAVSGYIHSQDGNAYALTIYTQNFKENPKEIKKFEDEIINLIYSR